MSLYHLQCIAPIIVGMLGGLVVSIIGEVKGWWYK